MSITDKREEVDTTIEPSGMQRSYLVLSEEERAKGFVRPVRQTYVHVGNGGPKNPTRALNDEERRLYHGLGFALFEQYENDQTGRYWTVEDLKAATGCGNSTSMGLALAETYARNPSFYSGTFCAHCRKHLPVGPDGEFVWEGTTERVGT